MELTGKLLVEQKQSLSVNQVQSLNILALTDRETGEGVSAETIKARIRQMISGEKDKPFSDQKLADMLAEEGIPVSRRAVTKYRIQMNIPDSRQRGMVL